MRVLERRNNATAYTATSSPTSRAAISGELVFVDDDRDAWRRTLAEFKAIEQLTDDWDGEGAEAPNKQVLSVTRSHLYHVLFVGHPAPNRIVATVNGGICAEWYQGSLYTEVEISPDDLEPRWQQFRMISDK